MDTKLKSIDFSGKRGLYAVVWLLCLAVGTVTGYLCSKFAAFANLYVLTKEEAIEYYGSIENFEREFGYFGGIVKDKVAFNDFSVEAAIYAAVAGIVFLVLLIILFVLTGSMRKNENGAILLNKFDLVWTELQIIAGGFAAFGAMACAIPMCDIFAHDGSCKFVEVLNVSDHYFGVKNSLIIVLCLVGMVACIAIAMLCAVTLVKKLKAHKFWSTSLVGKVFITIGRALRTVIFSGDNILKKIMIIVILGVLLSATWLGVPVVIALAFVFLPKYTNRFKEIMQGADEVRNGNLTYKIPEYTGKCPMDELNILADDINSISEASGRAIQNELKNQRMKTELISNVSHDLKTPLTSMVSYIDLLKTEGLESPNAYEYLNIVDEKTQRLRTLTENLFEAAKASSGAIPVNMEAIDLASLINQGLGEMDSRLKASQLSVIVKNSCEENGEEGVKVEADGQLLWRVIENLLGNVSKYALEGSRVYINLSDIAGDDSRESSRKGQVLMEIKNISRDELNISADELMERFKRGDESRNTEGSGLGLAIAKDLTRLMNGIFEIKVDGDLFKASVLLNRA